MWQKKLHKSRETILLKDLNAAKIISVLKPIYSFELILVNSNVGNHIVGD